MSSRALPQARSHASAPKTAPASSVSRVLRQPGRALDEPASGFLSSRFGHDFSQVRIHDDALASTSAKELHAHAFTAGNHIVFGSGEYQPRSASGMRLLAHEAAHTIQQQFARATQLDSLPVSQGKSLYEQDADDAARRAVSGETVAVRTRLPHGAIQRAEYGTYVSTVGEKPYLDAGYEFYKRWGYPNVKRVDNMQDVLTDLDKSKGNIDKFRIVTHGIGENLELGMVPGIKETFFDTEATEYTTQQRFRQYAAQFRITDDKLFTTTVGVLRKDKDAAALLTIIGVGKTDPKEDEPLGIVLRALLDRVYLANAKKKDGTPAVIKNKAELDRFVSLRLSSFKPVVVDALPKDQRADAGKAIDDLGTKIEPLLSAANVTFTAFEDAELDTFADPFLDDKSKKLQKGVQTSLAEGSGGGTYLKTLKSVNRKISKSTHVELRGCTLGKYPTFLTKLRNFFNPADPPSMSAPDLYQYFFAIKEFKGYGSNAAEQTKLESDYNDKTTGAQAGFREASLRKSGSMMRSVNEATLAEFAAKYGFTATTLQTLNPEIGATLSPGTEVWLRQRRTIKAGPFKSLDDVLTKYLNRPGQKDKLAAANPGIKDPAKLDPTDTINLPDDLLTKPIAEEPGLTEYKAALGGGDVVVGGDNANVLYTDATKTKDAIMKWLATQRWDPDGKTAAQLSKVYKDSGDFGGKVIGTYIEFLSRDFPIIVDPLFPEDPRYAKHIIQSP